MASRSNWDPLGAIMPVGISTNRFLLQGLAFFLFSCSSWRVF